jgi:hypothetical protein
MHQLAIGHILKMTGRVLPIFHYRFDRPLPSGNIFRDP